MSQWLLRYRETTKTCRDFLGRQLVDLALVQDGAKPCHPSESGWPLHCKFTTFRSTTVRALAVRRWLGSQLWTGPLGPVPLPATFRHVHPKSYKNLQVFSFFPDTVISEMLLLRRLSCHVSEATGCESCRKLTQTSIESWQGEAGEVSGNQDLFLGKTAMIQTYLDHHDHVWIMTIVTIWDDKWQQVRLTLNANIDNIDNIDNIVT